MTTLARPRLEANLPAGACAPGARYVVRGGIVGDARRWPSRAHEVRSGALTGIADRHPRPEIGAGIEEEWRAP